MHERHFQPTATQFSHQQVASQDRNQLASVNHGRPSVTAMDTIGGHRFDQQARMANERPGNRINERRNDQQQRIAQGIHSGQMTPGEAARTERREQKINRQVGTERRANGGSLTPGERQQVNREQNRASRQIHQEKHNDKTAPK